MVLSAADVMPIERWNDLHEPSLYFHVLVYQVVNKKIILNCDPGFNW
jgi:hypothetical protein